VHLVRQWRYPGGAIRGRFRRHCEVAEDPLHGAKRERPKEVGLQATNWESLARVLSDGQCAVSPALPVRSPVLVEHPRDGANMT
jgi:ribosomal protein L34E